MNHIFPFFLAVPTERGSEQYVRLAADPTLADLSKVYFVSGKEKPEASSQLSLDLDLQKRVNDAAEAWAAPFLGGRRCHMRRPDRFEHDCGS